MQTRNAGEYQCCAMEKQCVGQKCMAWITHYEEDKTVKTFPAPPLLKATGYGYCGLAHK